MQVQAQEVYTSLKTDLTTGYNVVKSYKDGNGNQAPIQLGEEHVYVGLRVLGEVLVAGSAFSFACAVLTGSPLAAAWALFKMVVSYNIFKLGVNSQEYFNSTDHKDYVLGIKSENPSAKVIILDSLRPDQMERLTKGMFFESKINELLASLLKNLKGIK